MTMPDPTQLVTIGMYSDGTKKVITQRLRGFLATVGIPEAMIGQGCKHSGSLSASTHNGLEVFDTEYLGDVDNPSESEAHRRHHLLRKMKDAGGCPWPRDERDSPDYGPGNRHTHVVVPNGARINRKIDPLAMSQVRAYWLGRNGLANNGVDRYKYRPDGHPIFNYKKWWTNEMQERVEQSAEKRIRASVKNHGALYHKLVQFVIRLRNHKPSKNH